MEVEHLSVSSISRPPSGPMPALRSYASPQTDTLVTDGAVRSSLHGCTAASAREHTCAIRGGTPPRRLSPRAMRVAAATVHIKHEARVATS
eukprot:6187991-Pleurochrysis_carterae.AAC.2